MSPDPFAPLAASRHKNPAKPRRSAVYPVPRGAPEAPEAHPKLGKATARWVYRDSEGAILGYVDRFDIDGQKEFRPLVLFSDATGKLGWRWESWPDPRPIYGLERIAGRPQAPILVTEGEKACDAASALLPGYCAVTSPNGSRSAGKADWSPLKGREVLIWPDADEAGLAYAQAVTEKAIEIGASKISVIVPPANAEPGWDAADAKSEGITPRQMGSLIENARQRWPSTDSGEKPRRRPPQADSLIALTELCYLWHSPSNEPFVSFPVRGHRENWPIASATFKRWLASQAYEKQGLVASEKALGDTIRLLEARAGFEGPQREPWLRTGSMNGNIYIDLGDANWRCVAISSSGWEILDRHELPFVRSSSMYPLPEPEAGEGIAALRSFLNVSSEDDFILCVAWVLAALRSKGPYPILVVNGEQGSGKSTFSRMMRSMVDPNAAPIRAAPREERDLIVAAANSHVISIDNLSKVEPWLADALCRIATGGGFSARQLHTDRDETVFQVVKPILLNGIPHLTERPDLADRCVTVRLKTIAEEKRLPEDEFWQAWDTALPRILGGLFDAVSVALRHMPSIKLEKVGRMADFEKWTVAAESAFDWEAGAFQMAYRDNRRDAADSAFAADPVATAISDLMQTRVEPWVGTATELLAVLADFVSEAVRRTRSWPFTAQGLGNRLDRVAPLLRGKGLHIERRHSGVRTVTIARVA